MGCVLKLRNCSTWEHVPGVCPKLLQSSPHHPITAWSAFKSLRASILQRFQLQVYHFVSGATAPHSHEHQPSIHFSIRTSVNPAAKTHRHPPEVQESKGGKCKISDWCLWELQIFRFEVEKGSFDKSKSQGTNKIHSNCSLSAIASIMKILL